MTKGQLAIELSAPKPIAFKMKNESARELTAELTLCSGE
jgi:hypothetical protein